MIELPRDGGAPTVVPLRSLRESPADPPARRASFEGMDSASEHVEPFRAYSNYFEDLAGVIGGRYGIAPTLAEGVIAAAGLHPALHAVQRRPLSRSAEREFQDLMRKGWGFLRRAQREVEDPDFFDEEANAYLPYFVYYATYHCGRAFAVASRQAVRREHAALLRTLSSVVTRGLMPYPWSAWCGGCPQTLEHHYGDVSAGGVHVLERPAYETSGERLAMLLRTTRRKQLDEYFAAQRRRNVTPGRSYRVVSRAEKSSAGRRLPPTTLFDVLYRVRKKVSYGDADVFVLGARDELEARRLADGLVVVCDGTVAMLEALSAAYAGPEVIWHAAHNYAERTESSLIGKRAGIWAARASGSTVAATDPNDGIPF